MSQMDKLTSVALVLSTDELTISKIGRTFLRVTLSVPEIIEVGLVQGFVSNILSIKLNEMMVEVFRIRDSTIIISPK